MERGPARKKDILRDISKWQEYILFKLQGVEHLIYSNRSMRVVTEGKRALITYEDGIFWLEMFNGAEERISFTQEHSADDVIMRVNGGKYW